MLPCSHADAPNALAYVEQVRKAITLHPVMIAELMDVVEEEIPVDDATFGELWIESLDA